MLGPEARKIMKIQWGPRSRSTWRHSGEFNCLQILYLILSYTETLLCATSDPLRFSLFQMPQYRPALPELQLTSHRFHLTRLVSCLGMPCCYRGAGWFKSPPCTHPNASGSAGLMYRNIWAMRDGSWQIQSFSFSSQMYCMVMVSWGTVPQDQAISQI